MALGRSAARQDEDQIEEPERVHDPQQQRDGDDRLQERQRQVPELPPGRGAVEFGRLVGLVRQAGEPRQHQQEDERRPLPDIDER